MYPDLIHPYIYESEPPAEPHVLAYLEVVEKLRYGGYQVGSNAEIRGKEGGGFIEWASAKHKQPILALTYMFGQSFMLTSQQIEHSANQAMQVIQMLLLKNSPVYEKFTNAARNKLIIKGTGTLQFPIAVHLTSADSSETIDKEYIVKVGQVVEVEVNAGMTVEVWAAGRK